MDKFGRSYKVVFTPKDGPPTSFNNLRVQFQYEGHVSNTSASSLELTVFGITAQFAKTVLKKFTKVEIYAGYVGLPAKQNIDIPLLYQGYIMFGTSYIEGTESILKIQGSIYDFYSNADQYKDGFSKTWDPPFSTASVLRDIVSTMGLSTSKSEFVSKQTSKSYQINASSPIEALGIFFQDHGGYEWTIVAGKLIVAKGKNSQILGSPVNVGWDNGLLTLPTTSGSGITFTSLLNSFIQPLSVIKLDPRIPVKRISFNDSVQYYNLNATGGSFEDARVSASGIYMVTDVMHHGDNLSKDPFSWATVVQCNKLNSATGGL